MTDVTTLIGVLTLLLVLVLIVTYSKSILEWWDQNQTDRKRQRAHDGKVSCEEDTEKCDKIATVLTHNGYFCNDHWEQNSKYWVESGGWVTWHHVLYHAIRRA